MKKLLYVDNNASDFEPILKNKLNHGNYNVISTSNPEDAVKKLTGIDLIMVGVGIAGDCGGLLNEWAPYFLPELKKEEPHAGYRLLRYVKKHNPEIKVIMFTGYENMKHEALSKGADGFIKKPFDISHLLPYVQSVTQNEKRRIK